MPICRGESLWTWAYTAKMQVKEIKLKTKIRTRWHSLYLLTHCNIGLRTACLVSNVELLHAEPLQPAANIKIVIFLGIIALKPYVPDQNSHTKRHILGMSTSPWNNPHWWKLCHLSCMLITANPFKTTLFSAFWGLQKFELFEPITRDDGRFHNIKKDFPAQITHMCTQLTCISKTENEFSKASVHSAESLCAEQIWGALKKFCNLTINK